jgi:hypothetical protein
MVERVCRHNRPGRMKETARLLAVALIAIVAWKPVASLRHELTVRHMRCAEHDELTHVRAPEDAAIETRRDSDAVLSEKPGTAPQHDHCSEGFVAPGRLSVSATSSMSRLPAPTSTMGAMRAGAMGTGREFVLANAPKTSPPSA